MTSPVQIFKKALGLQQELDPPDVSNAVRRTQELDLSNANIVLAYNRRPKDAAYGENLRSTANRVTLALAEIEKVDELVTAQWGERPSCWPVEALNIRLNHFGDADSRKSWDVATAPTSYRTAIEGFLTRRAAWQRGARSS